MGKDGLNLSGPSLLIYAIIYGFSQDGESACSCHIQYFQDWADVCERTARDIISGLTRAGYIYRTEIGSGRGSYVEYKSNLEIAEAAMKGAKFAPIFKGAKSSEKGAKSCTKGGKICQQDNNIIIYKDKYLLANASSAQEEKKEIFKLFFFKNSIDPREEVEAYWRANELAEWKDGKGRKLDTFLKRVIWADGWPLKLGTSRTNDYFIDLWRAIYNEAIKANDQIAERLVDLRIKCATSSDYVTFYLPQDILDWLEGKAQEHGRIYDMLRRFLKARKLRYQPISNASDE